MDKSEKLIIAYAKESLIHTVNQLTKIGHMDGGHLRSEDEYSLGLITAYINMINFIYPKEKFIYYKLDPTLRFFRGKDYKPITVEEI